MSTYPRGTLSGQGWIEEKSPSKREATTTRWHSLGKGETRELPRGARVRIYKRLVGGEHLILLVELDEPGTLRGPLVWAITEESARLNLGKLEARWSIASALLLVTAAMSTGLALTLEGFGAGAGLPAIASRAVAVVSLTAGVLAGMRALLAWADTILGGRHVGRLRARGGWREWLSPAPKNLTRTVVSGRPPSWLIEPKQDNRPALIRHADNVLQDLRTRASELPEDERVGIMASIERVETELQEKTALTIEDSHVRGEVRDMEASLAALEAQIGIRRPGPAS